MSIGLLLNYMCSECQQADYEERGLNPTITLVSEFGKIIGKQSQAISKLAEYVDRINANSKAPFSNDVEEEIKKILE